MKFTDKQKEILDKDKHGLFVVKAAPGSGKTFTITKKAMDIINEWDGSGGLALLSFTNVAVDEMKKTFKSFDETFEIRHPHFIGTLDSFINNYIFLPFGHIEMGCNCRPKLVGPPFNFWVGRNYSQQRFIDITRNLNGDWIKVPGSNLEHDWMSKPYFIIEKEKLLHKGYANRADAHYYALKVLENQKHVLSLIVKRFPYIILDESQDTSDIQMKILDILVDNGLSNLILVGDPEQAIYEWNDANPMLFEDKYQLWKSDSISLNENFRCSASICDFISKFSHTNFISKNHENLLEKEPKFKTYTDNAEIIDIIKEFNEYCDDNHILKDNNSRAILFRSQNFAKEFKMGGSQFTINEIFSGWEMEPTFTRFIVLGKYLWDLKFKKEAFKLLEKAFIMLTEKVRFVTNEQISSVIENKGLLNYRRAVLKFINEIPLTSSDENIDNWILTINESLNWEIKLKKTKNIKNSNFKGVFGDIRFDVDNLSDDCHFGTIHSVKGKSFRAVLLILKEKSASNKKYCNMLNNYNLFNEEELRIPYVAMTRAKEILWIAVPQQDLSTWQRKANTNPSIRSVQQTLF